MDETQYTVPGTLLINAMSAPTFRSVPVMVTLTNTGVVVMSNDGMLITYTADDQTADPNVSVVELDIASPREWTGEHHAVIIGLETTGWWLTTASLEGR